MNGGGAGSTNAPADPLLQFFEHAHLPEPLREVSRNFCILAYRIVDTLPRNPERTVALRKLLEAKDCAVRALLFKSHVTKVTAPFDDEDTKVGGGS